jgi:methylmalonyl-CoA/ethylmalonyl-CoA epimerase
MGFVHIDHVGIVAYTIEQAQEILGDALGLELDQSRSLWPKGVYFPPEQTYNYFFQVGDGETQVEVLIAERGATSGTARFLERRGPGLHHLCYA